jgi:uncharacterized protein (TIGR00255 family)
MYYGETNTAFWLFCPRKQSSVRRVLIQMIASMTGFAAAGRELEYGTLNIELRSVNHRYLEIQLRLPEELRALETTMRDVIGARLSRGKVDCRLTHTPKSGAERAAALNTEALAQLAHYGEEIRRAIPDVRPLSVANVLNYPNIFGEEALPLERIAADAKALLDDALAELGQTREREGEKLKDFLLERVVRMRELAAQVSPRVPQIVAAYQERLAARVKEAVGSLDDERMRQEIVLFASKVDVEEELSRLQAHLTEIRNVLSQGGQAGKRLDFLMQELNREANTLGSKAAATDVSKASVEFKVLIEQMREQVQNIE